ncbi:MAG: N-6 DNA methylase [Rhodospirillaceae bacterium]|nr:N-6 DNA methylase [Rhodospirillaceae bacterium]MDE0617308.1 N-6 DNA methylase [Rhodospirillaceae bacterium]
MSALARIEEESSRARFLASSVEQQHQMIFARSVVFGAINAYWQQLQIESDRHWTLRKPPFDIEHYSMPKEARELAENIGCAAAKLDVMDAGYAIGVLYTATMPGGIRARQGAYYTPPALCECLLDMATMEGVDWRTARILDPACGGGAFLSPVARRMASSLRDCEAKIAVQDIQRRLHGYELDPFAAWMSQVFLDVTLADLCHLAGMRLNSVVRVCDSLEQTVDGERFDLVVGNPPYGRVRLSTGARKKFQRSLFGHANLYGVFTDLALRFAQPGGVIAYVTPTSFLAGEYFKALRGLLGREAPPVSIDFVAKRKGIFADVLQETLLATYKRGGTSRTGKVHFLSSGGDGSVVRTTAGSFNLPEDPSRPWLMPRTEAQSALVRQVDELPYRLADYGYTVSTGPLVWNRHKASLRDRPGKGRYPLIWAEAVRPEGVFSFRAEKRNHKPYFEPKAKERWVVTEFPCVLLQRTTAKEQCRRLIAAELPAAFIAEHGAVVIENHLNMIRPLNGTPKVAPAALAVLLNSDVVDQVFRCINGSVAVSAYELEALPLPLPKNMAEIERLVNERANQATLERAVERLYGHGAG